MATDYATYKAMIEAHETGAATPEQQREFAAYVLRLKQQHNHEMREADRDARDAYHEGRSSAAADARGEPYGTY